MQNRMKMPHEKCMGNAINSRAKTEKKKTTTRTIKDKYNDNVAAIFDIEPANVAVVQLLLLLLLHSY